eukprot:6178234-Pleurochrysis_carterae.AAC.1
MVAHPKCFSSQHLRCDAEEVAVVGKGSSSQALSAAPNAEPQKGRTRGNALNLLAQAHGLSANA